MKRFPLLAVIFCTALVAFAPGCLITRHSTNVVRKNEKPRKVQFESAQAKNIFDGKVAEQKADKGMSNPNVFAVPFLLWYSTTDVVSDNGIYNDQIAICDTDGDRIITLQEAETYAARFDAKMAKREAVKTKSDSDAGDVFISDQPPKTQQAPISQTGLLTR